jgi:hypothetical protein
MPAAAPQFLADLYAQEKKRKAPASSSDEAPKKRGRPVGSKNKPKVA